MIARLPSIPFLHISLAALVAGFLLIISGYVPLAVIGAGLVLFAFLLPFLQLGIKPNPPVVPLCAQPNQRQRSRNGQRQKRRRPRFRCSIPMKRCKRSRIFCAFLASVEKSPSMKLKRRPRLVAASESS